MSARGISKRGIVVIWVSLMGLLGLTWSASRIDLGPANTVVAMVISGAKMLLVILFFMQVRFRSREVWIFAAAGFFWWTIFISLALTDYCTRKTVVPYQRSSEPAPQGLYVESHRMG